MTDVGHPKRSRKASLKARLEDRDFRRQFFWAQASAAIAEQLIELRKRRRLNQAELADLVGTKQPAISRAEKASYQNWKVQTIRSLADALDARVRVIIEPAEDILSEYEGQNLDLSRAQDPRELGRKADSGAPPLLRQERKVVQAVGGGRSAR